MKIGWPLGVNKIIIDSTTLDLGEGTVENDLEVGQTESWLKSSCIPETINVTMDFDFFEKDEDGLSEFDRFNRWFKFVHKYGTVPFEFPTIYKTGRETKSLSTYRIKKSPSYQKRGLCNRASMVWEEVFKEIINIPNVETSIVQGYAENGTFSIILNQTPATSITTDSFKTHLYKNDQEIPLEILSIETDGAVIGYSFNPLNESGVYTITVSDDKTVLNLNFVVE